VPDVLDSVKALAADYRRWSAESEGSDAAKANKYRTHAINLETVAQEVESARNRLRAIPSEYGDLSDLPSEVMAQLTLARIDELEQQMRDVVAAADGAEVTLDQIIIELYRRHKVVQERRFIMNKLYRMAQKGLISSVDGRKGVYFLSKSGPAKGGYDDLDEDIPF
jgi:hypothetical protein